MTKLPSVQDSNYFVEECLKNILDRVERKAHRNAVGGVKNEKIAEIRTFSSIASMSAPASINAIKNDSFPSFNP